RPSNTLDLLSCSFFGNIQYVVDRDNSNEHAGSVSYRQRGAIVLAECGDRSFLIVCGFKGHESTVHKVAYTVIQWGQKEFANADVINQQALVANNINNIQGLAVLAVGTDIVQYFTNCPMLTHADIMRRHEPANRIFGITEKC